MGDIDVWQGDCLERMRDIPDASVDALVTDPPFGIGFLYGEKRETTSDPAAYWEWLRPRYDEAMRCLKPGGFVAVWQSQVNFPHFWTWFGPDIHIYCAAKNFVQIRPTPINYGYDPVVMFYKGGAEPIRALEWRRTIDFYVANTANMKTRKETKGHPCPRPLDQVTEILVNFVVEGGLVLDPFAGSGTTLLACVKTGRRAIGIEVEPGYVSLIDVRRRGPATPLFACIEGDEPGDGEADRVVAGKVGVRNIT